MKYQAIKHNKTTRPRLLKMCDTLEEAKRTVDQYAQVKATYTGRSYIGGFPTYTDEEGRRYSIQGAAHFPDGRYVVCSIDAKELTAHGL